MAIDRRAVFTDAVVFTGVRQLDALREVKPGLLTLGQMRHDPGVKQEVIVIGFAAFDGVGGARFAVGDILLLGVADKVVNPVFCPLVAYPAADGKDLVQIVAGLQERRDVGDAVSRIAAGGVDRFVVQPAGRQRLLQIEEHLVGIEGLMIGVETPGEIPSRQRLAVKGQLCPILIGILLRRGEATDLAFRKRRERIEGEGLIAIVHLAHQILAEEVGIGVLEAD